MKSEQTTVILFGEGDTEQEVRVLYDLECNCSLSFFGVTEYRLTKVKVLDVVTLEPSDLIVDIMDQIALQLGIRVGRVKMDCTPEVLITAEETVKHF